MRKSLLLLAAIIPLAGAALALPAIAGSVASAPQADPSAIDLDAIPVKPVSGPLAVKGVAGDDEDEGFVAGKAGEHHRGESIEAGDDAGMHEADDDQD